MKILSELVRIASELEQKGLFEQADDLDAVIANLTDSERSGGGEGHLMPSSLAADDQDLLSQTLKTEVDGDPVTDEMGTEDFWNTNATTQQGYAQTEEDLFRDTVLPPETAVPPKAPPLSPEKIRANKVKRLARKVSDFMDTQRIFSDVPPPPRNSKRPVKMQDYHRDFVLQSMRFLTIADERLELEAKKLSLDLSDYEKNNMLRDIGFSALERSGHSKYKFDFNVAVGEWSAHDKTTEDPLGDGDMAL